MAGVTATSGAVALSPIRTDQRIVVGAEREVVVPPGPGWVVVVVVEDVVVAAVVDVDVEDVSGTVGTAAVVVVVLGGGLGAVVVVVTVTRTAGTSSVGRSGSGRTTSYSTNVTRKAAVRTSVEVRGRPVTVRRGRRRRRQAADWRSRPPGRPGRCDLAAPG